MQFETQSNELLETETPIIAPNKYSDQIIHKDSVDVPSSKAKYSSDEIKALKERTDFPNRAKLPNARFAFCHSRSTEFVRTPNVLGSSLSNGFLIRAFTRLVFPTLESPSIKHWPLKTN